MTLLFAGSTGVTLAYIAAFAVAVEASAGDRHHRHRTVYLGALIAGRGRPHAGGLGAIEAALVAGLTGVGMAAGPAVSAVLLYRLATYWLPVAPGWLCWRALQRREYV